MQRVFVLSADGQALDPCHPARARSLLRERHAAIARRYPFTIILKERVAVESVVHAHRSRSILVQRLRAWPW